MKRQALFLSLSGCLITILVCVLTQVAVPNNNEVTLSQIDKSNFPDIDVYVSIVDSSGKPIQGMPQTAFTVTENKTQVKIADFPQAGQREPAPITTVLVIDRSSSMNSASKIDGAKEAAINYVQLMDEKSRICLIIFNERVEKVLDFTNDEQKLIDEINKIVPSGTTAFYDAVYMAVEQLQGISGRNVVLALTDGLENESSHSIDEVIQYATEQNISLYTVGLGSDVDAARLEQMALQTGGKYAFSPTAQELAALYGLRAKQIQQEYRLSYTSPDPDRNGVKREVVVKFNLGMVPYGTKGWYNPGGFLGGSKQTTAPVNWTLFMLALLILILLAIIPFITRQLKTATVGEELGEEQPALPKFTDKPTMPTFTTPPLSDSTVEEAITILGVPEQAAQAPTSDEVKITLFPDEEGDDAESPVEQQTPEDELGIVLLGEELVEEQTEKEQIELVEEKQVEQTEEGKQPVEEENQVEPVEAEQMAKEVDEKTEFPSDTQKSNSNN